MRLHLLLTSISLICAIPNPLVANSLPISSLPLKLGYGGRLIVQADINGIGPNDFVIDTASTAIVLFENMAQQIDIKTADKDDTNVISFAGSERFPTFQIDLLEIGSEKLENAEIIVLPNWKDYARTPQGILGIKFFGDRTAVFDLNIKELQLYTNPPDFLQTGWASVALERETFGLVSTPLFLMPLEVGRKQLTFLLDTGAQASVCNYAAADFMRVLPKRARLPQIDTTVSDAVGTRAETFQYNPAIVTIAGIERQEREILISDAPFFSAVGYNSQPFGLVGLNYLLETSFAIDFDAGRLYIKIP